MVLGKLPVPGRPTHLEISRTRANCACSSCGWGLFEHLFLSSVISSFFLPFSLGDGPIKTEILSQRAIKPKTTNLSLFVQRGVHILLKDVHLKLRYICKI